MFAFSGRFIAALGVLSGSDAVACPWCDSPTAARVRNGIFDSDFIGNAIQAALPLLILSLLVAAIYFWPARGDREHV